MITSQRKSKQENTQPKSKLLYNKYLLLEEKINKFENILNNYK